jgi:hypothetical protein
VTTDTIDYVATDQTGLTSTSTRTVIVEAAVAAATSTARRLSVGWVFDLGAPYARSSAASKRRLNSALPHNDLEGSFRASCTQSHFLSDCTCGQSGESQAVRRQFTIIAFALVFLCAPRLAAGAELRVIKLCPDRSCENAYLYIIGKIEPGDAGRVRDTIKRYGAGIEALMLRSPGGSMYDSIEIGTLASDLMLNTFAPYAPNYCANEDARWGIAGAPCTCVSGCFLIWMGGVNRYGTVVGMHRPWDMSGTMGRSDYQDAAALYKKWIGDLDVYLTKMELPQAYFAKFISTVRSGDMRMLSGEELLQLNENPSKGEWLSNRCGQWTTQRRFKSEVQQCSIDGMAE